MATTQETEYEFYSDEEEVTFSDDDDEDLLGLLGASTDNETKVKTQDDGSSASEQEKYPSNEHNSEQGDGVSWSNSQALKEGKEKDDSNSDEAISLGDLSDMSDSEIDEKGESSVDIDQLLGFSEDEDRGSEHHKTHSSLENCESPEYIEKVARLEPIADIEVPLELCKSRESDCNEDEGPSSDNDPKGTTSDWGDIDEVLGLSTPNSAVGMAAVKQVELDERIGQEDTAERSTDVQNDPCETKWGDGSELLSDNAKTEHTSSNVDELESVTVQQKEHDENRSRNSSIFGQDSINDILGIAENSNEETLGRGNEPGGLVQQQCLNSDTDNQQANEESPKKDTTHLALADHYYRKIVTNGKEEFVEPSPNQKDGDSESGPSLVDTACKDKNKKNKSSKRKKARGGLTSGGNDKQKQQLGCGGSSSAAVSVEVQELILSFYEFLEKENGSADLGTSAARVWKQNLADFVRESRVYPHLIADATLQSILGTDIGEQVNNNHKEDKGAVLAVDEMLPTIEQLASCCCRGSRFQGSSRTKKIEVFLCVLDLQSEDMVNTLRQQEINGSVMESVPDSTNCAYIRGITARFVPVHTLLKWKSSIAHVHDMIKKSKEQEKIWSQIVSASPSIQCMKKSNLLRKDHFTLRNSTMRESNAAEREEKEVPFTSIQKRKDYRKRTSSAPVYTFKPQINKPSMHNGSENGVVIDSEQSKSVFLRMNRDVEERRTKERQVEQRVEREQCASSEKVNTKHICSGSERIVKRTGRETIKKSEIFERLHNSRIEFLSKNYDEHHKYKTFDESCGQKLFSPVINEKSRKMLEAKFMPGELHISESLYLNAMDKLRRQHEIRTERDRYFDSSAKLKATNAKSISLLLRRIEKDSKRFFHQCDAGGKAYLEFKECINFLQNLHLLPPLSQLSLGEDGADRAFVFRVWKLLRHRVVKGVQYNRVAPFVQYVTVGVFFSMNNNTSIEHRMSACSEGGSDPSGGSTSWQNLASSLHSECSSKQHAMSSFTSTDWHELVSILETKDEAEAHAIIKQLRVYYQTRKQHGREGQSTDRHLPSSKQEHVNLHRKHNPRTEFTLNGLPVKSSDSLEEFHEYQSRTTREKINTLREDMEAEEMRECTFKPTLCSASLAQCKTIESEVVEQNLQGEANPRGVFNSVHDRLFYEAKLKHKKQWEHVQNAKLREKQQQDRSVQECTFKPNLFYFSESTPEDRLLALSEQLKRNEFPRGYEESIQKNRNALKERERVKEILTKPVSSPQSGAQRRDGRTQIEPFRLLSGSRCDGEMHGGNPRTRAYLAKKHDEHHSLRQSTLRGGTERTNNEKNSLQRTHVIHTPAHSESIVGSSPHFSSASNFGSDIPSVVPPKPILYVDVHVTPEKKCRVAVWKNDNPKQLANELALHENLSKGKAAQLENLLLQEIQAFQSSSAFSLIG